MEIWLGYFHHYIALLLSLLFLVSETLYLEQISGKTPAVSVLEMFLERLIIFYFREITHEYLWVGHERIHGMLLRSLGSFLRCDDTLFPSGSVRTFNLLFEP